MVIEILMFTAVVVHSHYVKTFFPPPKKKELQLSFELWKTANLVLAYESIVGVIMVILGVPPESLVKIHMNVRLSSWLAINKIIESHCSTLCKDQFTELARGFCPIQPCHGSNI